MHCRLTTVPNGFSSRLKQALDDSEMLPKPYVSQCDGKQGALDLTSIESELAGNSGLS